MFESKQQSCSLTEYVSCPPQAWGKGDVGMPWSTAYLLGANLDPYQFELRNAAWPRRLRLTTHTEAKRATNKNLGFMLRVRRKRLIFAKLLIEVLFMIFLFL